MPLLLLLFPILSFAGVLSPAAIAVAEESVEGNVAGEQPSLRKVVAGEVCDNADVGFEQPSLRKVVAIQKEFNGNASGISLMGKESSTTPTTINGILKFEKGFDVQLLPQGTKIRSKTSSFATLEIPISELPKLDSIKGVIYFDVSRKNSLNLDSASIKSNFADAHFGVGFSKSFNGKGVIVGVVDVGFDYTHPTFGDRISRVWEQNSAGTLPSGYDYGTEIVGNAAVKQAKSDKYIGSSWLDETHGTHVTAIAAGEDSQFMGLAPEAEIVLVSTNLKDDGLLDGIKYIVDYAKKQGKPCVVNMSLGHLVGPRDGSAQFTQMSDEIMEEAGKGRILVRAAGNSGDRKWHLSKTLNNDTLRSLAYFPMLATSKMVDVWADSLIEIAVEIWDAGGEKKASTNFYIPNGNVYEQIYQLDAGGTNVNLKIQITGEAKNANNKKSHVEVKLSGANISLLDNYFQPAIAITGRGRVDAWNTDEQSFFPGGDSLYTINDDASAFNSIVAGAFVTRKSWVTFNGLPKTANTNELGNFTDYSSLGPTLDGRIKPEISAPGQMVASAFNSFSEKISQGDGADYVVKKNGEFSFGVIGGTSMAAPMVSGAVALLLEQNSNLTLEEARTLLMNNAKKDSWTGAGENAMWGAGKLNVGAALKAAGAGTPILRGGFYGGADGFNGGGFYDGANGGVIDGTANGRAANDGMAKHIYIYNIRGDFIAKGSSVPKNLPQGVYILKIIPENGSARVTKRIVTVL